MSLPQRDKVIEEIKRTDDVVEADMLDAVGVDPSDATATSKDKSAMTPEKQARLAFIRELRASDYASQPERPLAVVVRVLSVRDIPIAQDKYSLAEVSDGKVSWFVCVPRDFVQSQQLALFVSDDAILPVDERYICRKLTIVTQRNLKGGVPMLAPVVRRNFYRANQGILCHIELFSELAKCAVGDVVADTLHILSVKKLKAERELRHIDQLAQEKANRAAKKARVRDHRRDDLTLEWCRNYETIGPAPDFVQETALDLIEDAPELFEQYADCLFEVTEKLCGINLSVYCDRSGCPRHPIGLCVNGEKVKDGPMVFYWNLIRRIGIDSALLKCANDFVIEGVLIGPGIRGGRFVGYQWNEFRVFDIYDITEGRLLPPIERRAFCREFKLRHVPIIAYHQRVFAEYPTIKDLRAYADGRTYYGYPRRGIVLRSEDESLDVWVQVKNVNFDTKKARVKASLNEEGV